jgi:hypothetical protein
MTAPIDRLNLVLPGEDRDVIDVFNYHCSYSLGGSIDYLGGAYNTMSVMGKVEYKSGTFRVKPVLTPEKLTELQKKNLIAILRQLWGSAANEVTTERVINSLQNRKVDPAILLSLDKLNGEWAEHTLRPQLAEVMRFIAVGSIKNPGIMTDINFVLRTGLKFDVNATYVKNYINQTALRLVVEMGTQQIEGLRLILQNALENEWSESLVSQMMSKGLSLTARENGWAMNYYNDRLDVWFKKYSGDGLRDAMKRAKDTASREYAQKVKYYQQVRANRISHTELVRAKVEAEKNSIKQFLSASKVQDVQKIWIRTSHTDNWESSIVNDGKILPLDGAYIVPADSTMTTDQGPSEINEQCYLEYEMRAA